MTTSAATNGAHAPAQNIEAEESVLGAMLVSQPAISAVVETGLRAEDFYRDRHRLIYTAILEVWEGGGAVDALTVAGHLESKAQLASAGGRELISALASTVPVPGNAAHYASIVLECSRLRSLERLGLELQRAVRQREGAADEIADQAERELFALGGSAASAELAHISAELEALVSEAEAIERGEERPHGLSTGLPDLDRLLGGLRAGELVIVAGRPSMGKSSLAQGFARAVAAQGRTVAVFSPEMSRAEIVQRLAFSEALLSSERWREGKLEAKDVARLRKAAAKLAELPLLVDDTAVVGVRHLRARGRRVKAEAEHSGAPLGLIVVDYLQLMEAQSRRRDASRVEDVTAISRGLKLLARELDVCVVAVSQLSRRCEERNDKRPLLSDLRESGSIEQDADAVILIYRDDYYNPESEEKGIAELNLAKHRSGPTGVVELAWSAPFTRFLPLERDREPEQPAGVWGTPQGAGPEPEPLLGEDELYDG